MRHTRIPETDGVKSKPEKNVRVQQIDLLGLGQAVVLQQNAAVGINIWPGVLDLAALQKNVRYHLVQQGNLGNQQRTEGSEWQECLEGRE